MTDKITVSQTSTRTIFALISAICVALLGAAYYLQYSHGQQPCPLCILQRYVYLGLAVVALFAATVGPARVGAMAVAGVLGLFAALGAGLAIWQITKGDTMASCLTDPVGEFVYGLPMRGWWPEFLAAYGGCADKYPPIFGVSLPLWSLIGFLALLTTSEFVMVKLLRSARN